MSSGFLLDTSILSLLAPGRSSPGDRLVAWLREREGDLYISAVTVAEIEQGICKLRRTGAPQRADALSHWMDAVLENAADRVLAFDAETGRIAGRLSDKAIAIGRHPGFADVAIAATAEVHDLLILTRNCKHFGPLEVAYADPVERLPDVAMVTRKSF